jgi:hypothetical protein
MKYDDVKWLLWKHEAKSIINICRMLSEHTKHSIKELTKYLDL